MLIHWPSLIGGLLLGLVPPRLLINSECRYLDFESIWTRVLKPQKSGQRRRRWWKLPLVWIDPFRGYIAGMLVFDAFEAAPHAEVMEKIGMLVLTTVLLVVILAVQTTGRGHERESLAPVAFLGGMMLALLPVVVALSAIALGIITTLAFTQFTAGYLATALATAGIGYLFLGRSLWLGACTLLVMVPLLINWLRHTRLVMPVRC